MRLWKCQRGSTSSEQMLVVSVIAVGVSAAGYLYVPTFQSGTNLLSHDVSSILSTHQIGATGPSGDPNAVGQGANGQGANGQGANGQGNGGGGSGGSNNCSGGTFSVHCSGQTLGNGGGNGQAHLVTPKTVAKLYDPNASAAEIAAARSEILRQTEEHTCSQYILSLITGESKSDVVVNTVAGGYTTPDTTAYRVPVLSSLLGGFGTFGQHVAGYQGFMNLNSMQAYLGDHGIHATVTKGVTESTIGNAIAHGQFVTVVMDADAQGNPMPGGRGNSGHTVHVTAVNGSEVTIQDQNGTREVNAADFQAALNAQGDKMLTTPIAGNQLEGSLAEK